ncbi:TonB-dependent receptor [Novosphingobium sp. JCM 18896]|uniref:TonB-dependent receptor n=1 Tax=Novosphingobium sp. JCM 18896 TaxID=2989731 RepID=UPI002221FD5B|nr:TonB-dependent receptor [Novosphingobium sp. JCM 18896]MCW1428117.1 TonB-dependent receptor [Novosphingobium sp. JCM 18896]
MSRNSLLASTAIAIGLGLPMQAMAQSSEGNVGLEEIVVTAQKREQSLQDVPIAVTAVTQENLQANRIFTVNDLSAVAPGVTVKPSAGGISTPSFTIRGQTSFGVVAGSDKQVSIYVDGVYIGSPRGSIFQLPDIQRLEVLRGPQGTLFGRNATAGAISVTTRDPNGDARVKLEGSYGNYDAYRLRATVETPQFGPFSAYFSYVRDYRRGEIRNAAEGTLWDRSNSPSGFGVKRSPRWLGTVDSNSYFAAVKFEPSDSFKLVYKYDRNDDKGTPEGTGFIGYDAAAGGGLLGGVLTALYSSQQTYAAPDGKRPDVVTNAWVTAREQRVQGHSATATWQATDSIVVKNIFAYRKATVFAPSAIDGVGTLTFTPQVVQPFALLSAVGQIGAGFFALPQAQQAAILGQFAAGLTPLVGSRVAIVNSQASSIAKQWSDELQVNYTSERLQATLGALWYHSDDEAGGPIGQQNTLTFGTFLPASGVIPLGNEGRYFNKATSLAAYAQLEFKVTPELEIVGGARVTYDKKTSSFRWDVRSATTGVVSPRPLIVPPEYSKTKPNFLIGVNWKPNQQTLLYAKYSTSFVSGGSTAGIVYEPETASSVELGFKGDFLDNRLRTNLALFHVDYNHFQSPQSTTAANSVAAVLPTLTTLYGAATAGELISSLSTFVVDQGKIRARGFELEVTAAPTRGLTLGGSVSYTDVKFPFINPAVLAGTGGVFRVTARPKWTASAYGSYETEPLFGETTLNFRADVLYRSKILFSLNPAIDIYASRSNASMAEVKGFALVNGRVALRHLSIGGADAELAVWGKNLTNRKDATFALFTPLATSANYVAPRTYGVELSIEF